MEKIKVIDIGLGKLHTPNGHGRKTLRIDFVLNQEVETSLEFRNFIAAKTEEFFNKEMK